MHRIPKLVNVVYAQFDVSQFAIPPYKLTASKFVTLNFIQILKNSLELKKKKKKEKFYLSVLL